MTEWRIPGMPRMTGFSELMSLMQGQAESLAELPAMLGELHGAVGGLTDALSATKQAAASAERATARVEEILTEIEGPILALRPGVERLARALDHPVVDRIPQTLEAIEATVMPIAASLERIRNRYAAARIRARSLARRALKRE